MKVYIAQLAPRLADLDYNTELIRKHYLKAERDGCHIFLMPELALTGYIPGDLLLKPSFIERLPNHIDQLRCITGNCVMLLATPELQAIGLINAVLALQNGHLIGSTGKVYLPNHGIFDEKRYFVPGTPCVIEAHGTKIGVPVCEDIWYNDVVDRLANSGAQLLLVPNASPWQLGKEQERMRVVKKCWHQHHLQILYCNQATVVDGIIYDGQSFVYDGLVQASMAAFTECSMVLDGRDGVVTAPLPQLDMVYNAIVMGIKAYALDNGFSEVLLGLSGGVDSALTAALAVDAMGPDNVTAVTMPSPFNTADGLEDVREIVKLLGCRKLELPINGIMDACDLTLPDLSSLAVENIQARIRGLLLMALANQKNALLLATANKSEFATGYCTIYGDMCGGFAPICDLYKTQVWELANWRNKRGLVIPPRVITKPPSAELRPGQLDSDDLPEYYLLDKILHLYLEEDLGSEQIISRGFDDKVVHKVLKMVQRAEYKRQQAAPGVKISSRYLGRDRRYPITMKSN